MLIHVVYTNTCAKYFTVFESQQLGAIPRKSSCTSGGRSFYLWFGVRYWRWQNRYLSDTFGPVSSFTGTYRADKWIVNIPETFINQASCDKGMLTATRCYCQVNSQSILLPLVYNKQYPDYSNSALLYSYN